MRSPDFWASRGLRKCILSREGKLVACMIGSHSVAWSGDGPLFGYDQIIFPAKRPLGIKMCKLICCELSNDPAPVGIAE
jgi:hypothetical protein